MDGEPGVRDRNWKNGNRPVILAAVLSALTAATITVLGQQLVYAHSAIDRAEVEHLLDRHSVEDEIKFENLHSDFVFVRTRQDRVLDRLARIETENRDLRRRVAILERQP